MEPRLSREQQEEIDRRSRACEKNDTTELRKQSRLAYLDKRKAKKLAEIEDERRDHEYIFEGVNLTEAEERELRKRKYTNLRRSSGSSAWYKW
jgi:pre-mRNA-splicing factor ATP-dependent RNA helicase DHX16